MYSKEYYQSKIQDLADQIIKGRQKKVNADYDFVKEDSELVQKYNQTLELMKAEELKESKPQEETKTTPKKK